MGDKPLDLHPSALAGLKSALDWYLQRNRTAAEKFVAEFDRAMELVVDSPRRWPTSEHGSRKLTLRRFPFAIFYRETQTSVQVLAVAHGHRRPGYWKDRV